MTDPTEHWLPVVGWADLYEVSDLGRVRSLDRRTHRGIRRGHVLKPFPGRNGYLSVDLSRDEVQARRTVHRLVLEAFAGPCPPGQEARHGPAGSRSDNRLANLCYGTHIENCEDRVRDGTHGRGERNKRAKLTAAIIAECTGRRAEGESYAAMAREFGVNKSSMRAAVTGKTWKHLQTG